MSDEHDGPPPGSADYAAISDRLAWLDSRLESSVESAVSGKIGLCRDCTHWRRESWDDADYGRCEMTENRNDEGSSFDTLALAHDGESYYAILHTRGSFGCVQFEQRAE